MDEFGFNKRNREKDQRYKDSSKKRLLNIIKKNSTPLQ